MKRTVLLLTAIGFLSLMTACNSAGNQQAADQETAVEDSTLVKMNMEVSPEVAAKMDSFLQAYYLLQHAMVESDSVNAPKIAGVILDKLNMIPLQEVTDSSQKDKARTEITGLRSELSRLQQSTSLADMRSNFELISGAAYRLIKTVGLKDVTVYRTFCPMAFDDKGAYWLSNSAAIRNPYFGHKMINCGFVKETLQF